MIVQMRVQDDWERAGMFLDSVFVPLISIGVLMSFHMVRYVIMWFLRRQYEYKPPKDNKTFTVNKTLIPVEVLLLLLICVNMYFSFILLDLFCPDDDTITNWLSVLLAILHILAVFPMMLNINRMKSFFYCGDEHLEFNLALENRNIKTVRIRKTEITSIEKTNKDFTVNLKDGRCVTLKKKNLAILNGCSVLLKMFEEWPSSS